MKIVLATSNKGKLKEFRQLLNQYEVLSFAELIAPFEIEEHGSTFMQNATIKAEAVYEKLKNSGFDDVAVLSDDSGISVDALNGAPGIYSARYAGVGASDAENREHLAQNIKNIGRTSSTAHYTACIALIIDGKLFTTHGWMHGSVITQERGEKGFGYDPLFIPNGYEQTLGELDDEIKSKISHRAKAAELAKIFLDKAAK